MTTPMPKLPIVAYYYSRNNGKSQHLVEKDPTDLMPDSGGIVTLLCKVSDAIAAIEASQPAQEGDAKDARIKVLEEALEWLMRWQVKNVKVWNNPAYDNAHEVLAAIASQKGGAV